MKSIAPKGMFNGFCIVSKLFKVGYSYNWISQKTEEAHFLLLVQIIAKQMNFI